MHNRKGRFGAEAKIQKNGNGGNQEMEKKELVNQLIHDSTGKTQNTATVNILL